MGLKRDEYWAVETNRGKIKKEKSHSCCEVLPCLSKTKRYLVLGLGCRVVKVKIVKVEESKRRGPRYDKQTKRG